MDIKFEDNRLNVIAALTVAAERALNEVGGEYVDGVQRRSRVDTGETKNSWRYEVTSSAVSTMVMEVGSDKENAIWEEFGTGEYAAGGNGRKGGWSYQDESGQWHHTKGKRPNRPFQCAHVALKDKCISHIQSEIAKGMK